MAGRTEARVFTSIWDDPYFLSLDEGSQRLYLFLLSQKDLAYCGVLPLRPTRWAKKAARLTPGEVETYLQILEGSAYPSANPDPESRGTPLLVIDQDTGEVLIRSLMRRDGIWKMPNLLKAAMESAGQVESPRIRGVLLAELNRLPLEETGSPQVKTLVGEFIAILEKGSPYPSAYPSAYPSPHPLDDPADNGSDDPTAKEYAYAGGWGEKVETYGNSPDPLIPGSPETSLPAQGRKRGTRLPDGFVLTDEMRTWAARETPHADAGLEFAIFRDYWMGKSGREGVKLDWLATWRNWMRNAEKRQAPRQRQNSRADEAAAVKARLAAARNTPVQGSLT